jgi:hypothetical protein
VEKTGSGVSCFTASGDGVADNRHIDVRNSRHIETTKHPMRETAAMKTKLILAAITAAFALTAMEAPAMAKNKRRVSVDVIQANGGDGGSDNVGDNTGNGGDGGTINFNGKKKKSKRKHRDADIEVIQANGGDGGSNNQGDNSGNGGDGGTINF